MTKVYFIQLADYNIWANNIAHSWFEKISDEQWEQPIVSSFGSIGETAFHIARAETIWLDRLNNVAAPVWPPADFKGTKKEIIEVWKKASKNLKSFVENFDETKMQTNLSFKRINGEPVEQPYYQIFSHVFNHSTYHRGQVVTMLRQVGFTDVCSTDMSGFFRK